jgi:hypothetical protein
MQRGMLARLAAHLHSQGNGDGNAIVIDDQCNVSGYIEHCCPTASAEYDPTGDVTSSFVLESAD